MNLREAILQLAHGIQGEGPTVAVDMVANAIESAQLDLAEALETIAKLEADMAKLRSCGLALQLGLEDPPRPDSTSEPGRHCPECAGTSICDSYMAVGGSPPCPACHGTGAAPEAKGEPYVIEELEGGAHYFDTSQWSRDARVELAAAKHELAEARASYVKAATERDAARAELANARANVANHRAHGETLQAKLDAAESALERARALGREWIKQPGTYAVDIVTRCGRELLAAIEDK